MRKNCLVTGSSGFVGRVLVAALKNDGYSVIEADIENGLDMGQWELVRDTGKVDNIIHLAARSYVPDSFIDPRSFYANNIQSTINALELARQWNAKFIFASSYVYGQPQYLPVNEAHPLVGLNPYMQSKILGEQLCESYAKLFGVKAIALRTFNIYGPGQNDKFLVPSIAAQAKKGLILLSDPEPRRDYIHVDDVVRAYLRAMEFVPEAFDAFNIGSGTSHSVREIVDLFIKIFGRNIAFKFSGKKRESEIAETRSDCTKAHRFLNWSAKIDFETGIRGLLAPFQS
ncbi:MAG: NAD(P)-dependent oxidoreductase [Desulfobacterales bacterium]|nr:NAD(P)-dependent oxidoreductase [Desulfobacterales bacterium]